MATYTLKRKTYGLADAASNTIGGIAGGVGKALDSQPAAVAGGLAGGALLGGKIAAGLSSLGGLGGYLASIGAGPIGWLVGAGLGAAATRGLGKGLKGASDSLQR